MNLFLHTGALKYLNLSWKRHYGDDDEDLSFEQQHLEEIARILPTTLESFSLEGYDVGPTVLRALHSRCPALRQICCELSNQEVFWDTEFCDTASCAFTFFPEGCVFSRGVVKNGDE